MPSNFTKKISSSLWRRINSVVNFIGLRLEVNQRIKLIPQQPILGNVLIVAPGTVEIPPKGWGAVETISWEVGNELFSSGYEVEILNSKSIYAWLTAARKKYNLVILQDDIKLLKTKLVFFKSKVILFSHYGYLAFPDKWHRSYRNKFRNFRKADFIAALSPKIYDLLITEFPNNEIVFVPNGSNLAFPNVGKGTLQEKEKLACVGKVERRKRQLELAKFCANNQIEIDFIGEIADKRIFEELEPKTLSRFIGSKSRSELIELLPNYKALVLFSDGEADALVLYEAQLAGIPIIVFEESIGSQNPDLPWIYLLSDLEELVSVIRELHKAENSPVTICNYANEHYKWNQRIKPILSLLERVDKQ